MSRQTSAPSYHVGRYESERPKRRSAEDVPGHLGIGNSEGRNPGQEESADDEEAHRRASHGTDDEYGEQRPPD